MVSIMFTRHSQMHKALLIFLHIHNVLLQWPIQQQYLVYSTNKTQHYYPWIANYKE